MNDLWSIELFPVLAVTFSDYKLYFMGFKMKNVEKEVVFFFFNLKGKENLSSTENLNKLR